MTISKKLKRYLDEEGIRYDAVPHPRTATASETAEAAHVPGECVAKTVVIHHEGGYALAVVPSSDRVDLTALQSLLDRRLGLASEKEISQLFHDCDIGAAPPVGAAYGVMTVVDKSLDDRDDIWFEAGDHKTLVHVTGAEFGQLMRDAAHEAISYHE